MAQVGSVPYGFLLGRNAVLQAGFRADISGRPPQLTMDYSAFGLAQNQQPARTFVRISSCRRSCPCRTRFLANMSLRWCFLEYKSLFHMPLSCQFFFPCLFC
eukprot:Skav223956  [mRNA]  locus=scaffold3540:138514:139160:+ [translate_table: standard]